jgi:hypothetical protein
MVTRSLSSPAEVTGGSSSNVIKKLLMSGRLRPCVYYRTTQYYLRHRLHALGGCLATVHVFSIDARMSDGLDVANYSVGTGSGTDGTWLSVW